MQKDTGILLKAGRFALFYYAIELSRIENTPDSSEPNSSEFDSVSSTTNESDHENDQSLFTLIPPLPIILINWRAIHS